MHPQTAIPITAGSNYVQLRVKREPEPFFLKIDESRSSSDEIVGEVVDHHGKCLKPSERIERRTIAAVTRAILSDGDFPLLIPVKPILPVPGKR